MLVGEHHGVEQCPADEGVHDKDNVDGERHAVVSVFLYTSVFNIRSHAFPSAFAGRIKQRRPPRNARDRRGRLSRLAVAHAAPRAAGGRAGGRAVRGKRVT